MNKSECNASRPCRILAVDDEPEVRNTYHQALAFDAELLGSDIENAFSMDSPPAADATDKEHDGFDLSIADQGERAVTLAKEALEAGHPFTVAFIDMRMPPGMDGLETAQALRALDERIYIVFVTAYSDRSAEELDRVMGHEILLLRKPFVNEEIYQLARSLNRSWQKDRKLEQALVAAEQANLAKDQFMAAMSHEFRTPLTSLLGYGTLLMESPLNGEQQQWIAQMERSGKGLLHRINDVLDTTKIQSGRLELLPTVFSLTEVTDELQELYLDQLNSNSQHFTIEKRITRSDKRRGDRNRLLQILSNLFSNAIKFSPQGEIKLLLSESDTDHICFTLEDNGIGMSAEILESAFHPFEQGDQRINRNYSGIGMGLHISLQLAEAMGGTLDAESSEGRGSRFMLTLPLQQVEEEASQPAVASRASELQLSGHVLLVEDTPKMQRLIERILQLWGLRVSVASDGKEGIELALATHYDLILMDIQMPIMGGIEATELLRQVGYTAPIVALTANVIETHRDQFLGAGGDDFLTKPINRTALKSVLEKYLPKTADSVTQDAESIMVDPQLVALFLERTTLLHQQLIDATAEQDWEQVYGIAHMVKGSGATFGYPKLTTLGKKICDAINQRHEGVATLSEELIAEMEQVLSTAPG